LQRQLLTTALSPDLQTAASPRPELPARALLIEAVASRVIDRLAEMQLDNVPKMVHTEI
jgi:hypothetical protein